MINLILLLLFNSLVCFGFYNACLYIPEKIERNYDKSDCYNCFKTVQEEVKGVLWFVEEWAKDKWFYKPLCGCVPCMASFHSTYVYFTFLFVADKMETGYFMIYPLYILALSGLNYLIDRE